jgi:hypothetical protein
MALRGRAVTGGTASRRRDLGRRIIDDGGCDLIRIDADWLSLAADIGTAFGSALSPCDWRKVAGPADEAAASAPYGDDARRSPRMAGSGTGRAAGADGLRRGRGDG